ncbi:MAG: transcription antitermination factor NusB [Erysipelotrichaceae bacterium]|nr:transcription antitermination factor NusB [Erysipelotrichaceae bacterium]
MNRHEYRVQIVTTLYQHLLLKNDLLASFEENFEGDDNEFFNTIKNDLVENKDVYIEEIGTHLKNWRFERLSFIDQAILLEAFAEFKTGINNKNIIIDEAIRIAKQYSDESSYKYINGVLDNL